MNKGKPYKVDNICGNNGKTVIQIRYFDKDQLVKDKDLKFFYLQYTGEMTFWGHLPQWVQVIPKEETK